MTDEKRKRLKRNRLFGWVMLNQFYGHAGQIHLKYREDNLIGSSTPFRRRLARINRKGDMNMPSSGKI